MLRILYIFSLFIFVLIVSSWAIQYSKPVSFELRDITVVTSTSTLIIFLIIIVIISLVIQRIIFYLTQLNQRYKFYRERTTYEKGYNAFMQGMIALANKDLKRAILEAKNVSKYLKNNTLSLLLTSETLKIEKKFDQLENVYETQICLVYVD